jgi:hypothetical protein
VNVQLQVADALDLTPNPSHQHTFTSLPDMAETGLEYDAWRSWFTLALEHVFHTTDGYTILYQTDRRQDGHLISKAALAIDVAWEDNVELRWHKIAVAHMGTDLRRPTYSHLLCFSRTGGPGLATPDVYMQGPKLYPNGIDSRSCDRGIHFLKSKGATAVADPFCGRGTILAHAQQAGLDVIGSDIDPDQIRLARQLLALATLFPTGAHP